MMAMEFHVWAPDPTKCGKVRNLVSPHQLDAATQAAQHARQQRLQDLREEGLMLKRQITDPVMRSGMRKWINGV